MAATRSEPSERQPDSWERALARSLKAWASFTLLLNCCQTLVSHPLFLSLGFPISKTLRLPQETLLENWRAPESVPMKRTVSWEET